ncbi:MAG: glycosyltransferase [Thermomicrobium sp.]|nr:glycosyltransferase [Thermomicrobium sp.]
MIRYVARLVEIAHAIAALRLIRTALGRVHPPQDDRDIGDAAVVAVVPVLDEQARLAPCLEGLLRQNFPLRTVLVVDTGSSDRTIDLVRAYRARDARVQLVCAGPPPRGWNGKVWGLRTGLQAAPDADWYLFVDADVRPAPTLVRRLLAAARARGVPVASVALRQAVMPDALSWLLHPAMLTSLVYRLGVPGQVYRSADHAFANGQVLLLARQVATTVPELASLAHANAEDVALAREMARRGVPVAFFDALDDSFVTMYRDGRALWHGWPRSLPLCDRRSVARNALDLAVLAATQGAWLPVLALAFRCRELRPAAALAAGLRAALLVGVRRAYRHPRRLYWLSPLTDPLVVARVVGASFARTVVWRGRRIVRRGM